MYPLCCQALKDSKEVEVIDMKIRRKVDPEKWPLPGLNVPNHTHTDFSQLINCPEFVPRQNLSSTNSGQFSTLFTPSDKWNLFTVLSTNAKQTATNNEGVLLKTETVCIQSLTYLCPLHCSAPLMFKNKQKIPKPTNVQHLNVGLQYKVFFKLCLQHAAVPNEHHLSSKYGLTEQGIACVRCTVSSSYSCPAISERFYWTKWIYTLIG